MADAPTPAPAGPPPPAPRPVRARRRARMLGALAFFAACALSYWLEHAAEHAFGNEAQSGLSLFGARNVYQYIVSAWPRTLVPRHTAVVRIDPDGDPAAAGLANNVCEQRAFLATLLPEIARYAPAAIVIDKFYSVSGCPSDPAKTARLASAFAGVAATVPLVVGLQLATDRPENAAFAVPSKPHIAFGAPIREGVVNTAGDTRRIPLGWVVRDTDAAPARWRNGLALEAAEAYDAMLWKKYPQLARLRADRMNPYLSLVAPDRFVVFDAGDVLCTTPAAAPGCGARAAPPVDPRYLRGRIVLLGEVGRDLDRHPTFIGPIPGLLLQANYVEALLDDRYFTPAPSWVNLLVGFAVFVAIEWALRRRSAPGALAVLAGVLALTFVLLLLVVRVFAYYVDPITVSAFILVVKLITWAGERMQQLGGEHREH